MEQNKKKHEELKNTLADKEKELNDREARIRLKEIELEEQEKEVTIEEPPEEDEIEDDPFLEKLTIIFLLVFLLFVIFIPGDWFNSLSMWVRAHIPGLK